MLLPEFDGEMRTTRRALERIPENRLSWRPHEKSQTLGAIATHLVSLLQWTGPIIERDELDVGTGPLPRAKEIESIAELLERFDRAVIETREKIAALSDDTLTHPWTLRAGERTFFSQPKFLAVRTMIFSHHIHHRAQLGLYLRLNDVPVPQMFGPSADEPM